MNKGVPVREWTLDCPACERFLKGGGRTVLRYTQGDAKNGILPTQERVADCDPCWSASPDTLPLTPDETRVAKTRSERGAQQIQMIQALAALRSTGIEIPSEAMWLLERELPESLTKGKTYCPDGHENPAGVKFCGECGSSMERGEQRAPEPEPEAEPEPDLSKLHGQTLKKMLRERGLSDTGTRDELIERLSQ